MDVEGFVCCCVFGDVCWLVVVFGKIGIVVVGRGILFELGFSFGVWYVWRDV